jgi:hypothetical protein
MSLIKIIGVGDELVFDLEKMAKDTKQIKVYLSEKAGRKAVLRIDADRSIPIRHFKQNVG